MTKTIEIEGMSCGHCVMAVKKELSKLNVNVKDVIVGKAEVEINGNEVTDNELKFAVEEAGFSVITIKE